MPANTDRQSFRNEDLVLSVSTNVNRHVWDESRYEAFIDELCGDREYQKEAIRIALRYWLGNNYTNLRALARASYDRNPTLQERYGSWAGMERHLQLPEQLAASLDLATGTGKSFVLYGLATILLAEGTVDRVLVLCPSTTIEAGLIEKFKDLASNSGLGDFLPADARISAPRIINASESITEGCICVENYHAILEHVGSSIRDSLQGKGATTLVLNDEAHHVANESAGKVKRWKEFLINAEYGFRYIMGVSGTCYVQDEYFADVIYRYSLRQAMEERYVKRVEYVADMPETGEHNEKWQLIRNRHEETKRKLQQQHRNILPLTIIVTNRVSRCKDVADELQSFLEETEGLPPDEVRRRILTVYNNAPDVAKLPYVDSPTSAVEWIVSVSMLNEGWDVKRVFQIVPHEERAFDSKLLIAQVLGRGLRVPTGWTGQQPEVTVFNHDAWAARIRHLVNEILEIEKRLSSQVLEDSPYHFELHNIDYTLTPTIAVKTAMTGPYKLFAKGSIDLPADSADQDISVEFERADTESRYKWQTKIQRKTFTAREIAIRMYERMEEAQDSDDPDPVMRTYYTDLWPVERLEELVKTSLALRGMTVATDNIRQKFLQALGPLRRKESDTIRYTPVPKRTFSLSTRQRQADSVSAAELRRDKVLFYTDETRTTVKDEQREFFDEVAELGSGFKAIPVHNLYDFKTPLNAVIAASDPERRFIIALLDRANLDHYDAWLKSTDMRFYEIDYLWRKARIGEHTKRGKFNPDFFIKAGNLILVVEIKGNEELIEPSDENRKKYEYAKLHFDQLNKDLEEQGSPIQYKFNFLTPKDIGTYFQYLRQGNIWKFKSDIDVILAEEL